MKKLNATIRYGAGVNTLTVDGMTFDRNTITTEQDSRLRRLVRGAYTKLQKGA